MQRIFKHLNNCAYQLVFLFFSPIKTSPPSNQKHCRVKHKDLRVYSCLTCSLTSWCSFQGLFAVQAKGNLICGTSLSRRHDWSHNPRTNRKNSPPRPQSSAPLCWVISVFFLFFLTAQKNKSHIRVFLQVLRRPCWLIGLGWERVWHRGRPLLGQIIKRGKCGRKKNWMKIREASEGGVKRKKEKKAAAAPAAPKDGNASG